MIGVGDCIGSYEIVASLQHGGMATLFLGRRRGAAGFSRHVAIKVVHPHLAGNPSFVRMFVEEAKLSARIQHPNVVHVEELSEAAGTYFLVMEYVHGCSLSELLRGLAKRGLRMRPEVAAAIALQVAAGLHAAHETRDEQGELLGVVHRDVSPQNVLISSAGHVKLIDFGIAKAASRDQRTATGTLKGKIAYMAPEQAFGEQIDRRADVYALGIVLWEMLTGRRLFKSDNDFRLLDMVREPDVTPPSRLAPQVPHALDQAVMAALEKSRDARPATAEELRVRIADASPEATRLAASALVELVQSAAGDALSARQEQLPQSMSAIIMGRPPTREAIGDLTVSSPSLALEGHADDSDPHTSLPTQPSSPMHGQRARRALPRWTVLGAGALGGLALLAAAIAWSTGSGANEEPPAEADAPAPLAASPPEPAAESEPRQQAVEIGREPLAVEDEREPLAVEPDAGTVVERPRPTAKRIRRPRARTKRPRRDEPATGAPILAGEDEF